MEGQMKEKRVADSLTEQFHEIRPEHLNGAYCRIDRTRNLCRKFVDGNPRGFLFREDRWDALSGEPCISDTGSLG